MNVNFFKSAFFLVVLASAAGTFQLEKLSNLTTANSTNTPTEDQLLAESKRLKLLESTPSFGFRNSVANASFLQFLQYFGDSEQRSHTGYDQSPLYLATTLNHDPYYRFFYFFLSESTTFYAGMPEKTVELMEKGLSYLEEHRSSDSYYVWRYKGTDELLFLDESKSAQHSFEMAAKWAEESDDKNSRLVASLSQQTADFLASDPDSVQAKIGAWSDVLMTTLDQKTRVRAINKIHELGGKVMISDSGRMSVEYPPSVKENEIDTKADI